MRGAAARFYLFPLRVFLFSSLCLALSFLSSSLCCFFLWHFYFLPLCCYFFLAFLFLSFIFPFLCSFVFFLCFVIVAFLFSIYIYNIINKISIISFVCAHAYAHARARQRRAKIRRTKKGGQKSRPLHVIQKIYLNIESVSVLFPYVCRVC